MKKIFFLFLILCIYNTFIYANEENILSKNFLNRLKNTEIINMDSIIKDLNLSSKRWENRIGIANPYYPEFNGIEFGYARKAVIKWYANYREDQRVCGLKFVDSIKKQYILQTFDNKIEAQQKGYIITHHKSCGLCSGLSDLAVYLSTPNLTKPAKKCSTLVKDRDIKKCYENEIGFSSLCAQVWTYNSKHTKKKCMLTCIKDYGLWAIISGKYKEFDNNLPDGSLRPCVKCDEIMSGAGFKYAAGRTRRNSYIRSAIVRDESEMHYVDHSLYFK